MHTWTTTCQAPVLEHHQLIRILALFRLQLAARPILQQRTSTPRANTPTTCAPTRYLALDTGMSDTSPAILQEIDTSFIGKDRGVGSPSSLRPAFAHPWV
eukprot:983306-Pleurochrysis_carterae.AAC.1